MWTKNNMPDQTGKTVIVTGANVGIGFKTALALYDKGAHVVITCRTAEKVEATFFSMSITFFPSFIDLIVLLSLLFSKIFKVKLFRIFWHNLNVYNIGKKSCHCEGIIPTA